MKYTNEYQITDGRVIFKIPIGNSRNFGLVFSADWSQWFIGLFTILK